MERWLEAALFSSRWLMTPFYMFARELVSEISGIAELTPEAAILMALSLIDLSLAGSLILIVIFSGYENFVSKIDADGHVDRPAWMGNGRFFRSEAATDWLNRSDFCDFPASDLHADW